MRYWLWDPKLEAGGIAFCGGAIALFSVFGDNPPLIRLAFLLVGLGIFVGGGATYCLLDDPEKEDLFFLKIAARLGFLLVGPGVGLFLWEVEQTQSFWLALGITGIPLASLGKLIWKHKRGNDPPSKEE